MLCSKQPSFPLPPEVTTNYHDFRAQRLTNRMGLAAVTARLEKKIDSTRAGRTTKSFIQ